MNAPGSDLRARFDVAAAALLFSTGGAAIKLTSLGGWEVSGLRSLVASIALWTLLPRARGRWSARTLLVACFYAGTLTSFTLATKLTTAGNAIFLQSTAPLYVLVLAPWLLAEPIRRADFVVAGLLGLGLYVILSAGSEVQSSAPNPGMGNTLGVVAGVCWAGTLIGLRGASRDSDSGHDGATTAVVAGNLLTFVISTPHLLALRDPPSMTDALAVLYLGLFQVAAAYAFLTRGLRRVTAFAASLIILLEPALNPLWAFVLHDERIGWGSIVGGTLILAASVTKSALERGISR